MQDELRELACASATLEIDNLTIDPTLAERPFEWQRLLFAGSILARSSIGPHREAALRIATGALLLAKDQSVRDAGAIILRKLSNQRAVDLALDKGRIKPDLDSRLGVV